jgi:hypothetical protein
MKFIKAQGMSALEILKLLQDMTRKNIKVMKSNNEEADKLSKEDNISSQHVVNLKYYYSKNKQLFKQNNLYIELHTRLLCFLKSLDDNYDVEITSDLTELIFQNNKLQDEIDFDDCLNRTKMGLIEFNEQHPFFKDNKFLKELVKFYTVNEDYEKCISLMNRDQENNF